MFDWVHGIGDRLPKEVEMAVSLGRNDAGAVEIQLGATVFADTEADGGDALGAFEDCPVANWPISEVEAPQVTLGELFKATDLSYPAGHHYSTDTPHPRQHE